MAAFKRSDTGETVQLSGWGTLGVIAGPAAVIVTIVLAALGLQEKNSAQFTELKVQLSRVESTLDQHKDEINRLRDKVTGH